MIIVIYVKYEYAYWEYIIHMYIELGVFQGVTYLRT